MRHEEACADACYARWHEAKGRLDDGQPLVGLEVVGCEDDVVVEGAEEEHHDEEGAAETLVVKEGDLHEGSTGGAGFEVPLVEGEDAD